MGSAVGDSFEQTQKTTHNEMQGNITSSLVGNVK